MGRGKSKNKQNKIEIKKYRRKSRLESRSRDLLDGLWETEVFQSHDLGESRDFGNMLLRNRRFSKSRLVHKVATVLLSRALM